VYSSRYSEHAEFVICLDLNITVEANKPLRSHAHFTSAFTRLFGLPPSFYGKTLSSGYG
jgi:hypothetical protein